MAIKDWFDILGRNSIVLTGLLVLGFFLYKKVWPFVERQLEEAQAARKLEIEKFSSALDRVMTVHATGMEKMVQSIDNLRSEVLRGRHNP